MGYGLRKEQPRTLLVIWRHLGRWGRVPTARELAAILRITHEQTAYMRIRRLRKDGYLVQREDGTWTINDVEVVDQPETAQLLLLAQDQCGRNPTGKLTHEELLQLAKKAGITLSADETGALIAKLLGAQYLTEPEQWPQHYKIGPRLHKEHEFLTLLAAELTSKKRKRGAQTRRRRVPSRRRRP